MSIFEQARVEAEKRYPYRTHDTEVMQWQKRQHRVTFTDGFLAGHEAATRTRVVTTVTELDALPIGSVVRDAHGYLWEHYCAGEWRMGGYGRSGASDDVADFGPFTVLYNPKETR